MNGERPDELRRIVIDGVRARRPVDPREADSIERFLAEIERLPDPFSEHADPVHVAVSAVILGPRGVVLHRHKILGTWVAPGGHIDAGEAPWDAALREATEETGLAVDHTGGVPRLIHVDVHQGPRDHTHLDLRYLLDGGVADPQPPPGESPDVGWFSWNEALAITEPCMKGILRSLAAAAG
jgi:8-oxo-dGTP pyrophosphatase MutT (NUDIX family)